MAGELAAMRVPDVDLGGPQKATETLRESSERWRASRVDVAEATRVRVSDDDQGAELSDWEAEANDWLARVQERLAETEWLGTFLSPPTEGLRIAQSGYMRASQLRDTLVGYLERLAQISAAVGRG